MNISKIGLNITNKSVQKQSANEEVQNYSSNPFGVSFKGNMIQADVFESATPKVVNKIAKKGKLFASAIVGNINNFNKSFQARMNSIVSFGKQLKTNVFETIDRVANTEISFDFKAFAETIQNKWFPDNQYKVKNLVKLPVENLKNMWQAELG